MNLQEAMDALGIETTVLPDADLTGEREVNFREANHYLVTFTRTTSEGNYNKRKLTVQFSCGSGWKREPTGAEVMRTMLSDAWTAEWYSFEEWAGDLGYDTDSRKAYATYQAVTEQSEELTEFLADSDSGNRLREWLDTEDIMDESLDDNPVIR